MSGSPSTFISQQSAREGGQDLAVPPYQEELDLTPGGDARDLHTKNPNPHEPVSHHLTSPIVNTIEEVIGGLSMNIH
jgi:hypothetical protein